MSIQFTIIGLGQVGSSIGLGLASQKSSVTRLGHDKNVKTAQAAKKAGAVDTTHINLHASVEEANVVLLCIPASEVPETLKEIAEDLQENTVILDFSSAKRASLEWAKILPEKRYFIGITPSINPDYLHTAKTGADSARADLFQNGTFLINSSQGTPEAATKLAVDLANLLGASSLFVEADEADSFTAMVHYLPQIVSASLLNLTVGQSGWVESRRVAGYPFAMAGLALTESEGIGPSLPLNKAHILRGLDTLIESLQATRAEIASEDQNALKQKFTQAEQARNLWLEERIRANWTRETKQPAETIKLGDVMQQLFVGGLFKRKDRK
jgi:prephenate dehydrogenase